VGEAGLLLNENRTVSIVAKSDVLALKFGAKAFEAMFQKIPSFGAALSAGLAHRLQQLSGRVQLPDHDRSQPPAELVALLPVEFVQRHRVLPLKHEGTRLTLGLVDDPNSQVLSAVRTMVPSADLNLVHIDSVFFNEVMGSLAGVEEWKDRGAAKAAPAEAAAARSPRLDKLLERMVAEGASDVHLSARHKPQWRIDGDMHTIGDTAVLGPTEVQELLEPVMEKRHRDQFAADSDTDFACAPGRGPFPRQRVPGQQRSGFGAAPDPLQDPDLRAARAAPGAGEAVRHPEGADPGHRPHGQRQVHHPGRDDRLHQQEQEVPRHHPGGPHRVRPPEPGLPHQPA
jgi:hypothetical protein